MAGSCSASDSTSTAEMLDAAMRSPARSGTQTGLGRIAELAGTLMSLVPYSAPDQTLIRRDRLVSHILVPSGRMHEGVGERST